MILSSAEDTDLMFIKKALSDRKLEPCPLPNFREMPHAYEETERWRRIVERYKWGAIIFLSDKEEDEHFTLVAIGEVDLVAGRVTDSERSATFPVPWYEQLAKHFRPLERTGARIPVPKCLGHYYGDYTCDGGYNPKGQLEPPCAWRDRCVTLLNGCARLRQLPEEVVKDKSAEEVVKLTTKMQEQLGPIPPPPVPDPKQIPVVREEEVKKVEKKTEVSKDFDVAGKLHAELLQRLAAKFPDRALGTDKKALSPGDFLITDRLANSSYISIDCMREKGWPLVLYTVRFKTNGIDVQTCLPVDSELYSAIPKSAVRSWTDGPRRSCVKGVPEVVTVDQMFDVISRMLDSMELPQKK